jgi:subtilase family serine protease
MSPSSSTRSRRAPTLASLIPTAAYVTIYFTSASPSNLPRPLQAIPDVAAEGDRFRIFIGGEAVSIGGTSASSPAFAGFVSLLNDARISSGKPPLGFLNPLIYSAKVAATFNDITIGNNPGCGTPGFNVKNSFKCMCGLLTGL